MTLKDNFNQTSEIDENRQKSPAGEPKEFRDFEQWYNCSFWNCVGINDSAIARVKDYMRQAWDTAANNYNVVYIDRTKNEINELQGIIDGAMQIQCTCDQKQIKAGYRCECGKAATVRKAIMDLTFYLKELKKP